MCQVLKGEDITMNQTDCLRSVKSRMTLGTSSMSRSQQSALFLTVMQVDRELSPKGNEPSNNLLSASMIVGPGVGG